MYLLFHYIERVISLQLCSITNLLNHRLICFFCVFFLLLVLPYFFHRYFAFSQLRIDLFSLQAPLRERYGVDITPLSYIPGGRIDMYLGNLNFFFIRESTSIRENGGISGFVHSFITEVARHKFRFIFIS